MFTLDNLSNVWGQFKTDIANFLNSLIISAGYTKLAPGLVKDGGDWSGIVLSGDHRYYAEISITGITKEYYPFVSFRKKAIDTGLFNNALVESIDGGVRIYASDLPTEVVEIDKIICIK